MSREPLPTRRLCETFRFDHGGSRYFGTVGYYPDGRPGEIFLTGGKPGTALDAMSRDAAVLASRALQEGVPLPDLRGSLTRLDDGSPAGPVAVLLDMLEAKP